MATAGRGAGGRHLVPSLVVEELGSTVTLHNPVHDPPSHDPRLHHTDTSAPRAMHPPRVSPPPTVWKDGTRTLTGPSVPGVTPRLGPGITWDAPVNATDQGEAVEEEVTLTRPTLDDPFGFTTELAPDGQTVVVRRAVGAATGQLQPGTVVISAGGQAVTSLLHLDTLKSETTTLTLRVRHPPAAAAALPPAEPWPTLRDDSLLPTPLDSPRYPHQHQHPSPGGEHQTQSAQATPGEGSSGEHTRGGAGDDGAEREQGRGMATHLLAATTEREEGDGPTLDDTARLDSLLDRTPTNASSPHANATATTDGSPTVHFATKLGHLEDSLTRVRVLEAAELAEVTAHRLDAIEAELAASQRRELIILTALTAIQQMQSTGAPRGTLDQLAHSVEEAALHGTGGGSPESLHRRHRSHRDGRVAGGAGGAKSPGCQALREAQARIARAKQELSDSKLYLGEVQSFHAHHTSPGTAEPSPYAPGAAEAVALPAQES